MTDNPQTTPANDDAVPPKDAISLANLAAISGIDEDTLLRRLAGILADREEEESDA